MCTAAGLFWPVLLITLNDSTSGAVAAKLAVLKLIGPFSLLFQVLQFQLGERFNVLNKATKKLESKASRKLYRWWPPRTNKLIWINLSVEFLPLLSQWHRWQEESFSWWSLPSVIPLRCQVIITRPWEQQPVSAASSCSQLTAAEVMKARSRPPTRPQALVQFGPADREEERSI